MRVFIVSDMEGVAGITIALTPVVSLAMNRSHSFRAPTVEELFSGAAHAGTGAVELGNPELAHERGVSHEAVLSVRSRRLVAQLAAYRNRIGNYTRLVALGDTMVAGARLPLLVYGQADAVISGADASVEWSATDALVLGVVGDVLRGSEADGTPLSYMPAPRVGSTMRWERGIWSGGAEVVRVARQHRVGAAEETPTHAYTLLRATFGVRGALGGRMHSVTLRGDNLTDRLYAESTSRIKDFAPAAGRSVSLLYRVEL